MTEGINADGSATYSTYETKEYIKAWFDDAAMLYNHMKLNFGEIFINPFEEPEKFHCFMIIEGYLISWHSARPSIAHGMKKSS